MEQSLYDVCKRKSNGEIDITWEELSKQFGLSSGSVLKDRFLRAKKNDNKSSYINGTASLDSNENASEKIDKYLATIKINQDGTQSSDRLILISENNSKDKRFLLKAHGYDPDEWILVNAISNFWNGMRPKDRGLETLHQSKITVKPMIEDGSLSLKDVEEFFETYTPKNYAQEHKPSHYKNNGLVLEIDLADVHVGNESLSFEEVKKRVVYLVEDIKERTSGMLLERIILVQLGDVMHMDTYNRTTTGGTLITYGDNYTNSWDNALSLLIWVIEELSKITKVEFINIQGNHDKVSAFTLGKATELAFRNNDNITFDVSSKLRKTKVIGISVVTFVHGDMPKKNIKSVIQREFKKEFGETEYAEVHVGHLHHEIVEEADGVIIRHVPSITVPDQWHEEQGYTGSKQRTMSFLWDKKKGLRDIWLTGVE